MPFLRMVLSWVLMIRDVRKEGKEEKYVFNDTHEVHVYIARDKKLLEQTQQGNSVVAAYLQTEPYLLSLLDFALAVYLGSVSCHLECSCHSIHVHSSFIHTNFVILIIMSVLR